MTECEKAFKRWQARQMYQLGMQIEEEGDVELGEMAKDIAKTQMDDMDPEQQKEG